MTDHSAVFDDWMYAVSPDDPSAQAGRMLPDGRQLTFHVDPPMGGEARLAILLWSADRKPLATTEDPSTWPVLEEVMPRREWPAPIYAGKRNPARTVNPLIAKLAEEAIADAILPADEDED